MIVSSTAWFLRHSLAAVRPYADHVVIVEGSDPLWIKLGNANSDGSSIDETAAVIKDEMERVGPGLAPITYIEPAVYRHRNAQRQRCLDEMRQLGASICLFVDADEFYHPEAYATIRTHFTTTVPPCAAWRFYNFYSRTHRLHDAPFMERCFRLEHGMHYSNDPAGQYIILQDGTKLWDTALEILSITCFHYNRVDDGAKLLHKLRYYLERDCHLPHGAAITTAQISDGDKIALLKLQEHGVFVPLAKQPSFAIKATLRDKPGATRKQLELIATAAKPPTEPHAPASEAYDFAAALYALQNPPV